MKNLFFSLIVLVLASSCINAEKNAKTSKNIKSTTAQDSGSTTMITGDFCIDESDCKRELVCTMGNCGATQKSCRSNSDCRLQGECLPKGTKKACVYK